MTRKQLEAAAWKATHRDYRAEWQGDRCVMVMGPNGSTLKALSTMSDSELKRRAGQ